MNEQYILLYSKQCIHSQNLIKSIYKDQSLYKKLYKQCIDDPGVVIPSNITIVPALIIKSDNGYETLQGSEVFKWIESKKNNTTSNNTTSNNKSFISTQPDNASNSLIESYDPITMNSGSLSDTFSTLDDSRPMSHCYQFIDKNSGYTKSDVNNMVTPTESDLTSMKSDTSNQLEQLIAQRNMDVTQKTQRQ
tara:strand:+ start:2782 stop:3357 length:576 start_codon:yes stop_codon:yes gene_type:complete